MAERYRQPAGLGHGIQVIGPQRIPGEGGPAARLLRVERDPDNRTPHIYSIRSSTRCMIPPDEDAASHTATPNEALSISDAMLRALTQAVGASARGEVPVGAIVLDPNGVPLACAANEVEGSDASAHAELLVMRRAAAARGTTRLEDCTLVVTLEPCPMCAAACVHFRIRRLVFGAYDPKGGGVEHGPRIFAEPACLHRPEAIGGVHEAESAELLRRFFRDRR